MKNTQIDCKCFFLLTIRRVDILSYKLLGFCSRTFFHYDFCTMQPVSANILSCYKYYANKKFTKQKTFNKMTFIRYHFTNIHVFLTRKRYIAFGTISAYVLLYPRCRMRCQTGTNTADEP